jgi:phosphohistidine phosphatase
MKSLLLIRHAKSNWDFDVDDFDRPLNQRGQHDAPEMAKRLLKKAIDIDAFVSSPAKRALTTAQHFAAAYGVNEKKIIVSDKLYEPTIPAFFSAVENLNDEFGTVALFSHNPGITDFATRLTTTEIEDMPTCAIFAVKVPVKHWREFSKVDKEFWFFDYPKS